MEKASFSKILKSVAATALSAAMVLTVATPAFASDTNQTYDLTITGNKDATVAHDYEAYQIFTGKLSKGILTEVQWGSGVSDPAAFIAALDKQNKTYEQASVKTAEDVSKVLSSVNNDAIAQEFAAVAKQFEKEIDHPFKSEAVTNSASHDSIFKSLPAGYYVIEDKSANLPQGDALSRTLVQVTADTTVATKYDVPSLIKQVKEASTDKGNDGQHRDGTWGQTADQQIGKSVQYKLTGVIPASAKDYDTYDYYLYDDLSAGLSFNNDVAVYTKVDEKGNPDESSKLDASKYTVVTDTKNFDAEAKADTAATFEVKFNNARDLAGQQVYVFYTALVNENAKIYTADNPNGATLVYSRNPHNHSDHGTHTTPTPKVYTYNINLSKKDGSSKQPLAGAQFTLQAEDKDGKFQELPVVVADEKTNTYRPAITDAEKSHAAVMTSGADGYIRIIGLDEGQYQFTETKAPDGYNTIKEPQSFTISSHFADEANGNTSLLTVAHNNETIDILNNKGSILPSTGGMGTVLFTVVGLCLMGGAALVLITKKRMANKA